MAHTKFNNGDLIKEKNKPVMFTNGNFFKFNESLVDKDGFIEIVGKGKIHIDNFELCNITFYKFASPSKIKSIYHEKNLCLGINEATKVITGIE